MILKAYTATAPGFTATNLLDYLPESKLKDGESGSILGWSRAVECQQDVAASSGRPEPHRWGTALSVSLSCTAFLCEGDTTDYGQ
jgi:hypothetical protein